MSQLHVHTYLVTLRVRDNVEEVPVVARHAGEAIDMAITTVLSRALKSGLDLLPEHLEAVQVEEEDD